MSTSTRSCSAARTRRSANAKRWWSSFKEAFDFILAGDEVKAQAATVVFAGPQPLPGGQGYVSDHVGLRAILRLPADG